MTASSGVVLSNLAYLIGAVVLAIIGGFVVWLRHRQPKSVDANVESFSRGLRAIAPDASSPGSRRPPAGGPPGGLRIQPRPGSDSGPELGETAESSTAGMGSSAGDATETAPDLRRSQKAGDSDGVVVDLSNPQAANHDAAGNGPAKRAGAETG